MTDEPREDTRPEEEDVEGHRLADPVSDPVDEKNQRDEDDDVEGHALGDPVPDPTP
jgi:hypothetical protein